MAARCRFHPGACPAPRDRSRRAQFLRSEIREEFTAGTPLRIHCGRFAHYSSQARNILGRAPPTDACQTNGASQTRYELLFREQLPKDKWQDPTVAVIIDFNRRIDAK